jgi:hypothetical protein
MKKWKPKKIIHRTRLEGLGGHEAWQLSQLKW